ncbi:hypothetical protein AB9H28_24650, partial [Salmonella enterica subsp. enterica serovar Kentucky]|uniref:hypothetical protein n=1 Tax=Salmonella enterica TaxID=28901 RepID=UPI003F4C9514
MLIGGKPTIVIMSTISSGTVSLLNEIGATVGVTSVKFLERGITNVKNFSDLTPAKEKISVFGRLYEFDDTQSLSDGIEFTNGAIYLTDSGNSYRMVNT